MYCYNKNSSILGFEGYCLTELLSFILGMFNIVAYCVMGITGSVEVVPLGVPLLIPYLHVFLWRTRFVTEAACFHPPFV